VVACLAQTAQTSRDIKNRLSEEEEERRRLQQKGGAKKPRKQKGRKKSRKSDGGKMQWKGMIHVHQTIKLRFGKRRWD